MNYNLGLQLYSLRNQLSVNFDKTLDEVARAGYEGVEFAGLHNQRPEHVAKILKELNLKLVAMHCDVLSTEGLERSLEEAEALNCEHLVCPWCTPETFENKKSIHQLAEKLNQANQLIKAQGKNLLYHNHDFEFSKLNGQSAFDILAKHLDSSIYFELDAYLAKVGGADSIEIMTLFPNHIKMLHLKDGLISPPNPNTAIGDGKMNYNAIFAALPLSVSWIFVELEDCATDMLKAIRKSAVNLANITNSTIT